MMCEYQSCGISRIQGSLFAEETGNNTEFDRFSVSFK